MRTAPVLCSLALVCSLAAGCASMNRCEPEAGLSPLRRAGKDLAVIISSPATILIKPFQETGYTFNRGGPGYAIAAPATYALGVVRHSYFTALHALDLALYPFYSFSSARPLPIYDMQTYPYAYLTRPGHDGMTHPPDDYLMPLHFLTLGISYWGDPYQWKYARNWAEPWRVRQPGLSDLPKPREPSHYRKEP